MAEKAVVTGQLNIVDETTSTNMVSYDLSNIFAPITSIQEQNKVIRQVSSADGVVALDKGGITSIRGFLIYIKDGIGPIVLKHDSNTNGISIGSSLLLFGTIDLVTIETASVQAITVEYLFFE